MVYSDIYSGSNAFPNMEDFVSHICEVIKAGTADGSIPAVPERNVDLMLEKHAERIVNIRTQASKDATEEQIRKYLSHDEWILRYCLSFSKDAAAVENIKKCLAWRALPENEERERRAVDGVDNELFAEFIRYGASRMLGTMKDGGFPLFIRNGMGSNSRMIDDIGTDKIYDIFIIQREYISMIQLKVMQKMRRIVKLSMIMDMKGTRLSELNDRRFGDMFGKVSKVSSSVWPQLLQKMVIVNAPSFFFHVFALFKFVLPKSTLEKMEFMKDNESLMKSEYVKTWIREETMPSYLGGPLNDLPPELTGALLLKDIRTQTVRVPARGSKKMFTDVPGEGPHSLNFEFGVPGYGVEFSAFYEEGTFTKNADATFTASKRKQMLLEKIKLKDNSTSKLDGIWKVNGPCRVTVVLNNDWSMVRSKDANYLVEMQESGDSKAEDDPFLAARLGGMTI